MGNELSSILKNKKCEAGTLEFPRQYKLFCPSKAELDITRAEKVQGFIIDHQIDLVINCAANTNVDKCEENPAQAFSVNTEGVENLARSCARAGARLVHISTDYVFSGLKTGEYLETDICDPINIYGVSKRQGEEAVLKYCLNSVIIRSSWLYGMTSRSFMKAIVELSVSQNVISVVDDQYGRPTSAMELSYFILLLAFSSHTGIYHCTCGGKPVTWYEYALLIVSQAKLDVEIRVCSTDTFPRSARRPENSCLDCTKLICAVGRKPRNWKDVACAFIRDHDMLKEWKVQK